MRRTEPGWYGNRLFIAATDSPCPRRQRAFHDWIGRFAIGRQRSLGECPLTPAELAQLRAGLDRIGEDGDRWLIAEVDPSRPVRTLGVARAPSCDPVVIA